MAISLSERDRRVIWHPYTQMQTAPPPLPITSGQGAWLTDESGKRYLDVTSSWWVNLHGHAHPYLAQKLYEQALVLEQVIFAGCTHGPAVQLAERLLPILPGAFSRIFYSDNGSTAVEVALKMAIQYWKNKGAPRKKILALTHSYHGDTFGAMSVSERGVFTLPFADYLFEVDFADIHSWENTALDWENIACFIYEPLVQGAGGMNMLPPARLDGLLKQCKAHGVLCIADEVMTGFGRTGKLFASRYLQEQPDIICLSKGITGGTMPLSVTACTQAIYEAFLSDERSRALFHGHSYTANPLACAVANASLDLLLGTECLNNIQRIGDQHAMFVAEHANEGLPIKSLRYLGTILAFEVETGGQQGYLNNISSTLHQKALKEGVLLRPLGNTVYLMPPYCITEEELRRVYDVVLKIIF